MDVKEVLFMSKGDGENSYARTSTYTVCFIQLPPPFSVINRMNSFLAVQQKVASVTKPTIASTVGSLLEEDFFPCKLLNVADLGCGSGPSPKCAHSNCPPPEFQFYLNDLAGNDFNTLFKSLSSFLQSYESLSCFIMGAPGSFHGRLFPRNCVHLAHSSYSVHWLSRGRISISKTSPDVVKEAYLAQFRADLSTFLKFRCEEMVDNGRLVLVLQGRKEEDFASIDNVDIWDKLGEAIADLVSEGFIEEEKLDTLNVPYYTASSEEVRGIVDEEGSFWIERMEIFEVNAEDTTADEDPRSIGRKMAKHARSYTGSIISHHLGEEIMDKLYGEKLPILLGDEFAKGRRTGVSIIAVLKKHVPTTQ
ncbi:hypothetical protein BT93_K0547 [Corymbia citriodora subsp. variegata]|nr:hypothetical protein BT93_K0547 [Corymbia citriodora subsp. variegata]